MMSACLSCTSDLSREQRGIERWKLVYDADTALLSAVLGDEQTQLSNTFPCCSRLTHCHHLHLVLIFSLCVCVCVCACMCYTLQSNNNNNNITNTDICCFIRTQEALGTVRECPKFEFLVSSDMYRNHNLSDVCPCLFHTSHSSEQISHVFYLSCCCTLCIFLAYLKRDV